MHTLFDFITHIKGVEYLLALLFIAWYIIYWEFLKPRPFRTVIDSGKEDLEFVRKEGYGTTLRNVGKAAAAPFIGLAYIIALPFVFLYALFSSVLYGIARLVGFETAFGWRPLESYMTGKKKEGKTDVRKEQDA